MWCPFFLLWFASKVNKSFMRLASGKNKEDMIDSIARKTETNSKRLVRRKSIIGHLKLIKSEMAGEAKLA